MTAPSEPPDPDPLDVDALMEDLRRRVAEKKARGLYGVDALMEASTEDAGDPFGLDELERLRELAVQRVDIAVTASTKPVVGGVVSRLKQLLVRGTSQPIYGLSAQATAFNAALIGYLSSLAREVSALERHLRAEREAGEAARAEVARLEGELSAAVTQVAAAREAVDRMADAALPERIARLERAPAPAPGEGAGDAGAGGLVRLRLEATEDDPGRAGRLEAYARALTAAGPRIVHVGAGSGRDLELLGEGVEGVESDGELAAAAAAGERFVRHAEPVAFLAAVPSGSIDGILVTNLVERIDGEALVALAGAIEHALAPSGVADRRGDRPRRPRRARRILARPRPAPAGAPRRRADDARVGRTGLHDGRGARRAGRRGVVGAAPLRRVCGPLTDSGSPSSSPGTASEWSAGRRCSAA